MVSTSVTPRAGRAPVRVRAPGRAATARRAAWAPRDSPACASAPRSNACWPRWRAAACAASGGACRARSATCCGTTASRCCRERATGAFAPVWPSLAARLRAGERRLTQRHRHRAQACRARGLRCPRSPRRPPRPGGHCRACMVEMDGRMVAACTTNVREGAQVLTDTEMLRDYRRDLGELMVSESSPRRPVAAQLEAWQVDGARYGRATPAPRARPQPPLPASRPDACILCRRCVRACEEIQASSCTPSPAAARSRLVGRRGVRRLGVCRAVRASPRAHRRHHRRRPRRAAEPVTGPNGVTRSTQEGVALTTRTTCGYCGVGTSSRYTATAATSIPSTASRPRPSTTTTCA